MQQGQITFKITFFRHFRLFQIISDFFRLFLTDALTPIMYCVVCNLQILEDKLLQVLEGEVSSQEITSHTEYVSSIVDHKETVFARLEEAEGALSRLDRIRDQLLPVSKRGAMLFSVVQSLQGVQREYRVSLPMFLWMFDQAVGEELPPEVAKEEQWNDVSSSLV